MEESARIQSPQQRETSSSHQTLGTPEFGAEVPAEINGNLVEGTMTALMAKNTCSLTGLVVEQIEKSKDRVGSFKHCAIQEVSSVRVSVIQKEENRRQGENHRTQNLEIKHKQSDITCEEIEAKIQAQWSVCFSSAQILKVPKYLHDMLVAQKKLCENYLESNDLLIEEYNLELRRKEDDYVKELKREADEIDQLLSIVDKQSFELRRVIKTELETIGTAFKKEREELVANNFSEIENLFNSRKAAEQRYLRDRARRVEDNSKSIDYLRVQDAEEFNLLKIKLETDVQVLEQQLQQLKAIYQLNTEKLEYNYQVLKKRDEESTVTVNQQKRRVTKQNDSLNIQKAKLLKAEREFNTLHHALQEDYIRISSQYNDLRKKFKHFQINDDSRFTELWQMNQQEISALISKLLMADKVIHELHLGLQWKCPNLVQKEDSKPSTKAGRASMRTKQVVLRKQLLEAKNPVVRAIMGILSVEADFLVDEKLGKLLLALPSQEQKLLKLDTIVKALQIETNEDLESCLQVFLNPDFKGSAHDLAADVNVTEPQLQEGMLIDVNDVPQALREYLTKRGSSKKQNHFDESKSIKTTQETNLPRTLQELRIKWDKIVEGILDDSKLLCWRSVLSSMQRFHDVLVSRGDCLKAVRSLMRSNIELKKMLKGYMTTDVNDLLRVPPGQILQKRLLAVKNDIT